MIPPAALYSLHAPRSAPPEIPFHQEELESERETSPVKLPEQEIATVVSPPVSESEDSTEDELNQEQTEEKDAKEPEKEIPDIMTKEKMREELEKSMSKFKQSLA